MAMTFHGFSPDVHVLYGTYLHWWSPSAVQQDSGTGCILQPDCPGPSEDQLDWLRMFSCHRTHRWDISLLQHHPGNSTVKLCITGRVEMICLFTCILPIQFSCASSSTELANRQRFRYYFQMLATEAELAIGFFGVIKQFGWKKVAFIEQDENLFTVVSSCAAVS